MSAIALRQARRFSTVGFRAKIVAPPSGTFREGGVLLATDAAGEGLNLHHNCRVVVNLELPWNPMRLEQRIGRVDRIGQTRTGPRVSFDRRRNRRSARASASGDPHRARSSGCRRPESSQRATTCGRLQRSRDGPDGGRGQSRTRSTDTGATCGSNGVDSELRCVSRYRAASTRHVHETSSHSIQAWIAGADGVPLCPVRRGWATCRL